MSEQVLPLKKKSDHYGIFMGEILPSGEIVENKQVGLAFARPSSRLFRLKLWGLQNEKYYLTADDEDSKGYVIISPEEYQTANGEKKTVWSRCGEGRLQGVFVRLQFWFLGREIFLCLFPEAKGSEAHNAA